MNHSPHDLETAKFDTPPISSDGTAQTGWGDDAALQRIEALPRDIGWLLIYVGVLGLVVPGVVGWPFLVVGGAILSPGGPKAFTRWAGRKPRRMVRMGITQMARLLDDLDRRYPALPKQPSSAKPHETEDPHAAMSKSHTFPGVTIPLLECMSAVNRGRYVLNRDEGKDTGTLTAKSGVGEVVVQFAYAREQAEMKVTVLKKPIFMPPPVVWAEFSLAMREAAAELAETAQPEQV